MLDIILYSKFENLDKRKIFSENKNYYFFLWFTIFWLFKSDIKEVDLVVVFVRGMGGFGYNWMVFRLWYLGLF